MNDQQLPPRKDRKISATIKKEKEIDDDDEAEFFSDSELIKICLDLFNETIHSISIPNTSLVNNTTTISFTQYF